jgi:hypothetical protein
MATRTVPFHSGLFRHAMISLLGRAPDVQSLLGWDGFYSFRYEPKDDTEKEKFARGAATLQEWLSMFEITPIRSCCEYGRLTHPQKDEENKDYLYICVVHPVEKKEERR